MSTSQKLIQEFRNIFQHKYEKLVKDCWSNDRDGYNYEIEFARGPGGQYHNGVDEDVDGYAEDSLNQKIVEGIVDDRFYEFISDFEQKTEDDADKILVYRCIQVSDLDEFLFHVAHGEPVGDYKGIGIFWAWDKDRAKCHWGKGGASVTVNARVPYNAVEMYDTLLLNLSPSLGRDEAEIRLKEGAKVEILGVETKDGYVSPLDEGFDPIEMQANIVRAFEERPMPVGPEPDGSFDRENQVVEIGMPEMNNIPLKEALMNRPYYLGREQKFMPDPVKYPAMHRLLKADRYRPEQPAAAEPVMQYPEVEQVLKDNKEPT